MREVEFRPSLNHYLLLFVCEQRRDDISAQMRRESRVRRITPSQTLGRIPPPELLDYNPCLSASTQGHRPQRAAAQKQINEEGRGRRRRWGGKGGEADKWRVVGEGEGELKGVASKGMGADRR